MIDKYTKQVLDFLRDSSREVKDAEWDRIANLGLESVSALTFVEDSMNDIALRSDNAGLELIDEGYRSLYEGDEYGAQNEAYMSRSAEKWVRGLCFNELGVCG